jgi:6-phosphogluconolactonase (cycloisomerase 2 family)
VLWLLAFFSSCGGSSSNSAFLYLASQGTTPGSVTAYSIDLSKGTLSSSNGQLTPVGKAANTGTQPSALLFNPTQTFAYTANTGSDDISLFTLNHDGSLAAGQGTTSVAGATTKATRPVALAIDSGAHFLFVANEGVFNSPTDPTQNIPGNVSVFSIGSGGALTQVPGSPFSLQETAPPLPVAPSQPFPSAIAASNQGNFVYVTDRTNGCVLGFSFDGTTGALSPVPGQIFLVGSAPNAVYSPPAGNFLYVANAGSNDIYEFIINSDGSLSSITTVGTTIPVIATTGNGPIAMLADPPAKFLFVVANQGNEVRGYLINHVTGVLNPVALTTGIGSTGAGPVAVAIRSDGSTTGNYWLFTSNSGASTVSTFSLVYNTGTLNPLPQLAAPLAPYGVAAR